MAIYITKKELNNKDLIKSLLLQANTAKDVIEEILNMMDFVFDEEGDENYPDGIEKMERKLYDLGIKTLEFRELEDRENSLREFTPNEEYFLGTYYSMKKSGNSTWKHCSSRLIDSMECKRELTEIIDLLKVDRKFGHSISKKSKLSQNFKKYIDKESETQVAKMQTAKFVYLIYGTHGIMENSKYNFFVECFDREEYDEYVSRLQYGIEFYKVVGVEDDNWMFALDVVAEPGDFVSIESEDGKIIDDFIECQFIDHDLYLMNDTKVNAYELAIICYMKGLKVVTY